jgi:sec-independent protein translocase protein TatA
MLVDRCLEAAAASSGLLAFLGNFGMPEMMIFGLVVLLLFGNRLPSVMRSLGVGVTEFKKGIRGEGMPDGSLEDQRSADERHEKTLTSK